MGLQLCNTNDNEMQRCNTERNTSRSNNRYKQPTSNMDTNDLIPYSRLSHNSAISNANLGRKSAGDAVLAAYTVKRDVNKSNGPNSSKSKHSSDRQKSVEQLTNPDQA